MDITKDPIGQMQNWFSEARLHVGINFDAMALASVDEDGAPDVRYVLLKRIGERGLEFFTNRESAKARQLFGCQKAAAAIYWREIGKQVRMRGKVTELDRKRVAEYFATRSRASQIGAWASRQSHPLAGMAELGDAVREVSVEFAEDDEIKLPEYWTGFLLAPEIIEFWQEGEDRLHERVRYQSGEQGWLPERLFP